MARVQRHGGFLRGEALLLPLGFTRGFIPRVKCNLNHLHEADYLTPRPLRKILFRNIKRAVFFLPKPILAHAQSRDRRRQWK